MAGTGLWVTVSDIWESVSAFSGVGFPRSANPLSAISHSRVSAALLPSELGFNLSGPSSRPQPVPDS